MACANCDPFDTEIRIHSPDQWVRVARKIREAATQGVLVYNGFESDREFIGQPSFLTLDLAGPLPDVMRYHFHCAACGNCYGLFVETYHGSGGTWSLLGNLPSRRAPRA